MAGDRRALGQSSRIYPTQITTVLPAEPNFPNGHCPIGQVPPHRKAALNACIGVGFGGAGRWGCREAACLLIIVTWPRTS